MVYQERNLVGMLTGAQNICLGHEPCRSGLIDGKGLNSLAEQIKHDLGLNVDLNTPVEQMGAGEQQLIEIMRALRTNPKILILDEPTASLGQGEIEPFLQFIQRIKSEREIAIIFISHKFEEVYEIADKIAVFTDGQNVLFAPSNELTQEMCIDAMLRQDKIKPLIISQTPTKDKQPLEELIDALCDEMKLHHVDRLQKGTCTLSQGFVFNDLLTNYERVADHCSNIAVAMIELEADSFDTHEYLSSVKAMKSAAYERYYEEYRQQFAL